MLRLLLVCLLIVTPFSTQAAEKIGVIGAANPEVSATAPGQATHKVQLGDALYFRDTITTSAKGNAQLLFNDKSALTVGANSSLTIDEFVYSPAEAGGSLSVSGTKGVFRFIGGALSKNKPVTIKTPVSTIGIRGGIAVVEVDAKGQTSATFVYGEEMTVTNLQGQVQATTVPGSGISVANGFTPPTPPVRVNPSALAVKLSKLEGSKGTHGGAKSVPDRAVVKEKLKTTAPQPAGNKSQESSSSTSNGDSGEPDTQQDSTEESSSPQQENSATTTDEQPQSRKGENTAPAQEAKPQSDTSAPTAGQPLAPRPPLTSATAPTSTSPSPAPLAVSQPTSPTTTTTPLSMQGSLTTLQNATLTTTTLNAVDKTQLACLQDARGFDCNGRHTLTATFFDPRGFDRSGRHKNGTFFDDVGYNLAGLDRRGFTRSGIFLANGTPYDFNGLDVNGNPKPIQVSSSSGTTTTTSSSSGTTDTSSSGGTTTTSSSGGSTSSSGSSTSSGSTSGGSTSSTSSSSGGDIYSSYRMQNGAMVFINPGCTISGCSKPDPAPASAFITSLGLNTVHDASVARCTTCNYADWGAWQYSLDTAAGVSGAPINKNKLDTVVMGIATQNFGSLTGLPTDLAYNGKMIGHIIDGSTRTYQDNGTFSANVNLSNRTLYNFEGNFSDFRFGFTAGSAAFPATGAAVINEIYVDDLGGAQFAAQGTLNVGLFGPQAQDMGGSFYVESPSNLVARGVFVGSR